MFEQTPFTKRYADSHWAAQQQIRLLLDESFDEDNEEDDEVVLGFEHNVPDHFPTSPLCPLHPKHKSGGKAICPMHGRYRRNDVDRVLKVGPARSNRTVSYARSGPELRADVAGTERRVQIVFDTRVVMEEAMTRARQWSMGSDGAIVQPSPDESREESGPSNESETLRRSSELESRGRPRARLAFGSDRSTRRRRVRCR